MEPSHTSKRKRIIYKLYLSVQAITLVFGVVGAGANIAFLIHDNFVLNQYAKEREKAFDPVKYLRENSNQKGPWEKYQKPKVKEKAAKNEVDDWVDVTDVARVSDNHTVKNLSDDEITSLLRDSYIETLREQGKMWGDIDYVTDKAYIGLIVALLMFPALAVFLGKKWIAWLFA